ncbi:hypothetical protein B9Z19DRAFT_1076026 [Tuber borchii]|uniref:Uncharacterized protein n=1 Tax=Tuber borchii TaxID=42251 RepID=A0A2T7A2E0_TUBBO|nr:hypothetical protein B9Z19DRAFT_1076026 [Tuber borchii]
MSSSHSDSHHPPPYDDADDPLISKPEKSLRPLISFDSWEQFQWHLISLSGRCLTTALSLSFLILSLVLFSQKKVLSQMEQYGFNAITILLSAFASLGLGSMLGYLGSMLRWRLLARKKYKMQDIELLLAMPSPSGSGALIYAHFRERRLSLTTFIVMLYLFVNITGRFSVALFGLTYNLLDDPDMKFPVLTTDWNSPECSILLAKNLSDINSEAMENGRRPYLDLAIGGLAILTRQPDLKPNISVPQTLNHERYEALTVGDSTIYEIDGGVTITYDITDDDGKPSGHNVSTRASCTMFHLNDSMYWEDHDSDDQTFKDWKDESNLETIAEVLRTLYDETLWSPGPELVAWAAPLANQSNEFSMTYVVYNETIWRCKSTLYELLFDPSSLFLLPIAGVIEPERELSATVFTTTREFFTRYPETFTRTTVFNPGARALVRNENKDDLAPATPTIGIRALVTRAPAITQVWTETRTWVSEGYTTSTVTKEPFTKGRTSSVAYKFFTDPESRTSPSFGLQTLNYSNDGTALSAEQRVYYNGYVATLVARLPIAAIAFGTLICPSIQKDPKDHKRKNRVAGAAGAIVASQILAIAVVLYYCRDVYVREDSYLATAELLKTVLIKIENGSVMTGVELETALDKVLGGPVRYGTIPGSQGDYPRVALGREVDYNFPEFPQFRKRSVFRW